MCLSIYKNRITLYKKVMLSGNILVSSVIQRPIQIGVNEPDEEQVECDESEYSKQFKSGILHLYILRPGYDDYCVMEVSVDTEDIVVIGHDGTVGVKRYTVSECEYMTMVEKLRKIRDYGICFECCSSNSVQYKSIEDLSWNDVHDMGIQSVRVRDVIVNLPIVEYGETFSCSPIEFVMNRINSSAKSLNEIYNPEK